MSEPRYPEKSRGIAITLAWFLGIFGAHRFYLGESNKGLKYIGLAFLLISPLLGMYDTYKFIVNPQWFSKSVTHAVEGESSEDDGTLSAGALQDNRVVMTVAGVNREVTLYSNRLEISRVEAGNTYEMQHNLKSNKEISYDSITGIQFRRPDDIPRGYIRFEQRGLSKNGDGPIDVTSNENTVLFNESDLSEFEELHQKIRDLKNGNIKQSTGSIDRVMEELREQYAEGGIDEEEYEHQKQILQKG